MARVIIRLHKSQMIHTTFDGGNRREIWGLAPLREFSQERDQPMDVLEFFDVDERDAEQCLAFLCKRHPGVEVSIHTMTKTGICPAGDLVMKNVSAEGILPA
jgi:hypothetical protein